MSDFDTVLERLLGDAGFQAALAKDPAAALRGYNLSEDEREVLRAQLVVGAGGQGPVETRTSKSGLVGMFAPIAGAVGMAAAAGYSSGNQSIGSALSDGDTGGGSTGGTESLGLAAPINAGAESIGSSDQTGGRESIGSSGGSFGDGFGAAIGSAGDGIESIGSGTPTGTVYRTVVDVDGDGKWDGYVATPREGGGYDLVVDMDHDGRTDFVGHDVNGDGLIDSADYDTNLDGRLDTRMYDDNGDGWLDRTEEIPPGGPAAS